MDIDAEMAKIQAEARQELADQQAERDAAQAEILVPQVVSNEEAPLAKVEKQPLMRTSTKAALGVGGLVGLFAAFQLGTILALAAVVFMFLGWVKFREMTKPKEDSDPASE